MLAAFGIFSCSDDDPESGPAPELPAGTTVMMNFETFSAADGRTYSLGHAHRAGTHVASWKNILTMDLAIPVNAFLASDGKKAEYTNGEWVWSYEYNTNSETYQAEIHAVEADTADQAWKMFISQPGNFEGFMWMEGVSSHDLKSGQWTIYDNPENNAPALHIHWKSNGDGEITDMKYVVNKGDFIQYVFTGEEPFSAYYNIEANKQPVTIEWHLEKKNGSIIEPTHYLDDLPRCWSSSFEDIDCG
ncbi:hypothetical protein C900_00810 [Fulvivirga imtechensis AK7]|uniref:Uncharacterized protein n=1 Tax=Fulvivirga imtechensis AK7 TaxID=1237149 RepID=L8JYY7_9BACT|nr:hypothetical protein C900_00810 [Fulvivirga imtechensis AK7]